MIFLLTSLILAHAQHPRCSEQLIHNVEEIRHHEICQTFPSECAAMLANESSAPKVLRRASVAKAIQLSAPDKLVETSRTALNQNSGRFDLRERYLALFLLHAANERKVALKKIATVGNKKAIDESLVVHNEQIAKLAKLVESENLENDLPEIIGIGKVLAQTAAAAYASEDHPVDPLSKVVDMNNESYKELATAYTKLRATPLTPKGNANSLVSMVNRPDSWFRALDGKNCQKLLSETNNRIQAIYNQKNKSQMQCQGTNLQTPLSNGKLLKVSLQGSDPLKKLNVKDFQGDEMHVFKHASCCLGEQSNSRIPRPSEDQCQSLFNVGQKKAKPTPSTKPSRSNRV